MSVWNCKFISPIKLEKEQEIKNTDITIVFVLNKGIKIMTVYLKKVNIKSDIQECVKTSNEAKSQAS